jgi:hypothetical protein
VTTYRIVSNGIGFRVQSLRRVWFWGRWRFERGHSHYGGSYVLEWLEVGHAQAWIRRALTRERARAHGWRPIKEIAGKW